MKKYKVTMVCKEIWRVERVITSDSTDLEVVKDQAWVNFDAFCNKDLEQDNYTKVEELEDTQR